MMEENKKHKPVAEVEIIDSGPLRISGNFILKDLQRDKETVPGEVYLCRCGRSSDKPFCDGSHKKT
jgi:CDGSH-type Zn-finger protein